jgi:ribosomal protein L9
MVATSQDLEVALNPENVRQTLHNNRVAIRNHHSDTMHGRVSTSDIDTLVSHRHPALSRSQIIGRHQIFAHGYNELKVISLCTLADSRSNYFRVNI